MKVATKYGTITIDLESWEDELLAKAADSDRLANAIDSAFGQMASVEPWIAALLEMALPAALEAGYAAGKAASLGKVSVAGDLRKASANGLDPSSLLAFLTDGLPVRIISTPGERLTVERDDRGRITSTIREPIPDLVQ